MTFAFATMFNCPNLLKTVFGFGISITFAFKLIRFIPNFKSLICGCSILTLSCIFFIDVFVGAKNLSGLVERGCFDPRNIVTIDERVKISQANVIANFAGHVHGYYDPDKWFLPDAIPPIQNPYFMDANYIYVGHAAPEALSVVTTEALMVASNEPAPKGVIRIVKVKDEEITIPVEAEGEFRALNPYFKQIDVELRPTLKWPPWKWVIEVEAYAFTKRFSEELPGTYVLYIDGTKVGEKQSKRWDSAVQFEFDYKCDKDYDFSLIVKGYTPDGKEEIVESINQTRHLHQPPLCCRSFQPS